MEQYKKMQRFRILLISGLFVVSVVVTSASWLTQTNESSQYYMLGLCAVLGIMTFMILLEYLRLCKNKEKLKAKAIQAQDERNIAIHEKVKSASFLVFVCLLALMTTIYAFIDVEKMNLLSSVLCLAVLVKLTLYVYYKRKL
ncbi:MAG: hypothetical protein EOM11_04100 [Erysipelotrichia bacterium]|nr:hypothetical protein [Erysipelotrichia bacterium]